MTLRGMYVNQSCKMEISVMCYVTCSDIIVVDVHLVSCYVMLSNHLIIKEVNVDSEQSCKAGNFRF